MQLLSNFIVEGCADVLVPMAIPSLRLSHGGERKTGRVKPFVGAIFVTALNGLLVSDFPEKTNTILIW